jgi:hypothetical protein
VEHLSICLFMWASSLLLPEIQIFATLSRDFLLYVFKKISVFFKVFKNLKR